MRFTQEGVIKELNLKVLTDLRKKNQEPNRAIEKFELKVTKLYDTPLDYILMLPKKVYSKLIDRTREKMLFGKQDELMQKLDDKKKEHKKY